MGKLQGRKSSTFYRIEKPIGDGYKSVYEFHTVVNGNMYYREYEERPDGRNGFLGESHKTTKEAGNRIYKRLIAEGYKFTGVYEMDIFGYKERYNEA